MKSKISNYSLTVSTSTHKGFWIINLISDEFIDLFSNGSITLNTVPKYEDMVVVDINLKDVSYEEIEELEDKLIKLEYLGEQWKLEKECK